MTIELKTEHGTFTGETVREAEKLANKAARLAEKEKERKDAIRAVAQQRAELAAWKVGYHVLKGDSVLPWTFCPDDGFYSGCKVTKKNHTEDEIEIETADGAATTTIGSGCYRGSVIRTDGTVLAVVIADPFDFEPKTIRVFGVGVNLFACELELIPNVKPEQFIQPKE